jgi:tRNA threonylcarbamoyladenosine biosynthesis protein TsaB
MIILAIDTASAAVSVAVHDGDAVLAERETPPSPRHAELLAPAVGEALAEVGLSPRDVTAIGVGVGPGPFTGLRVGLVTARVMGHALGVDVHGVCSLDVLAAGAARLGLTGEFLVATDARRREVYWGRYVADPPSVGRVSPNGALGGGRNGASSGPSAGVTPSWRRLEGPHVSVPADVKSAGLPVAGRGAMLYPGALLEAGDDAREPLDPTAGDLAGIVATALRTPEASGVLMPPDPLYLRRPDVREPGVRKRVLPS